jgi:hypothetical protein
MITTQITDTQAIEKAFDYLKNLKPEYLGKVEEIRLEAIQFFGTEWVVILSYLTKRKQEGGDKYRNPLLDALSYQRYYKEFDIDASTGDVRAMKNPESPELTIGQVTLGNAS